jgi:hypothetical protein
MIGVPVAFEGEVSDEREAELREIVNLNINIISLQGDMDLSGDNADLTFYRSIRERNTMTQFFYLPKTSWRDVMKTSWDTRNKRHGTPEKCFNSRLEFNTVFLNTNYAMTRR